MQGYISLVRVIDFKVCIAFKMKFVVGFLFLCLFGISFANISDQCTDLSLRDCIKADHIYKLEKEYNPSFYADDHEDSVTGDDVNIELNGTHVCIYYKGILLKCVKLSDLSDVVCGMKLGSALSIGCAQDEEKHLGLCYKKCSILTGGSNPLRTATNTCAKNGCSSDEDEDAGLCYPKCRENYISVGPVCWGSCSVFCGNAFKDVGLYCYRWWLPKSCGRPKYGRGVGTLPYSPWTKGLGCNGFGVAGDGGCARIDIKDMLPYEFGCQ